MNNSSLHQTLSAETDSCVDPSVGRYSVPATMKAAILVGPQQVEIQDVAVPAPGANEILVRVEGCGVCGSNLPVWEGRPWFSYPLAPGQPGHEAWGHVVQVGKEVQGMHAGDRVAMLSYAGYAEYDLAAASSTVLLPPTMAAKP